MRSLLFLFAFLSSAFCLKAQEFFFKPGWKDYLDQSDLRPKLGRLYYQENPLQELVSGYFYEVLIAFKDREREDLHGRIRFTSFLDISNYRVPLKVQEKQGNGYIAAYKDIDKRDVQFLILDRRFLFKPLRIREDVYSFDDPYLCFVVVNGPICYYYYPKYLSDSNLSFNIHKMHRDMVNFGSQPTSMGGFNFKKNVSAKFEDHPELANKIRTGMDGYKKKEGYDIIVEYNEWVKENDPDRYWTYMAR
jgi:hypothetical protein